MKFKDAGWGYIAGFIAGKGWSLRLIFFDSQIFICITPVFIYNKSILVFHEPHAANDFYL